MATVLAALPAAAETVRFPSATAPPTPLQLRLFKERSQPIAVPPSLELTGEFYRPAGDGPFPAVVQLHGCGGRGTRESEDSDGAYMVALGYALLIVDSFGPRDIKEHCSGQWSGMERISDAYGGLFYLAGLPFIDPDRIAVLGYSQGADVALSAVKLRGLGTLFDRHFRTAIAYYPWCDIFLGAVSVPTLILIGQLDDWTPMRNCRELMAKRSGEGASLRLMVYPHAYHGFNIARLRGKPAENYLGHHIEYSEAADRAAWAETVAALRESFGR